MPAFVVQGGSDGTWGTEHNDSHAVFSDPTTGNLTIVSYENDGVYYENEAVTVYDRQYT
jgi:hypothetical protein